MKRFGSPRLSVILALTAACTPGAPRARPPIAVASTAPVVVSAPADAPNPVAELVRRWDRAHSARDAHALEALYADSVRFYGADLGRADCVKRKAAAFAAAPDYEQTSADVKTMPDGAGGFFVTLTKIASQGGVSRRFPAYLYVDGGRIVAEGDYKPVPDPIGRTCITITPDDWFVPNDHVTAPYRISALEAVQTAMRSSHFLALRKNSGKNLKIGIIACAGRVDLAGARSDDYALEVTGDRWLVEDRWVSVDGVTKAVSWGSAATSQ